MRPDLKKRYKGLEYTVRWIEDPGEEVVLIAKNLAYVLIGSPSGAMVDADWAGFWKIADSVFVPHGGGDPTNGGEDIARFAESGFAEHSRLLEAA